MFKFVVILSAFLIAACAALFSVTGIAQLFTGAAIAAAIMAGSLELGKLVAVSFLYRYWKTVPRLLKSYLFVGSLVLVLITSLGIYGYLASAYGKGSAGVLEQQSKITLYESQKQSINGDIERLTNRVSTLQSVRTQQENRLDSLIARGRSITAQNQQIRQADTDIRALNTELQSLTAKRDSLELLKQVTTTELTTNSKLGTFYYIAETFNVPLDTIVKWFILVIVFVFDPLSISLVLAYNHLVLLDRPKKKPKDEDEIVVIESPPSVEPIVEPVIETPVQEKSDIPYYRDDNYDWDGDDRWRTDPLAIEWKRSFRRSY